jgi:hypothetical protein
MIVNDVEFCLRMARALLPTRPLKAATFVNRALAETVDPRLRFLVLPAVSMIENYDIEAADRWLDRALKYHEARRADRLAASLAASRFGDSHRR